MERKQRHFVNLTNGIEHIPEILKNGHEVNFVRMQSTTIERNNWLKLIGDLDHNLLMYMALGYDCYFYDCGTNRPLSKTCYLGVPIVNYVLKRRWTGEIPTALRWSRNGKNVYEESQFYDFIYHSLFHYSQYNETKGVKRKVDYYKRFLSGEVGNLIPVSCSTNMDGNYQFYSNIANNLL